MANLQGLYLVEPHGRLIAEHRKTLIAKSKHLPLEGDWLLLSKDNGRGLEYGKITVGQPRVVTIDKFDSLFKYHRVTPKERSRWWPTKIELYLYPITNLEPHGKPKSVEIPAGTQTIMETIKYLDKPSEPKEPKEPNDVEPGQDRERPYSEVGAPRAGDTHSDPAEKARHRRDQCMECDKAPEVEVIWANGRGRAWFCKECFAKWKEEMGNPEIVKQRQVHSGSVGGKYGEEPEPKREQKEARMPWTTADPPGCAKNWTESEKKKCIKAANAVLRDGGKEQDAIFACIRAAGKTKHPGGKKAQKTVNGFLTLQAYLDLLDLDEIMVKMIHGCETVTGDKARGEGQGVGGPRQGESPPSHCVCPKCGHETEHKPDEPCSGIECPKCGAPMKGKDAEKDTKEIEPNDMIYEPGDKGVNAQDATKGGRRLQSSKLEFLGNLKGKLESLLKELGELIGWASYDDQKPIMFQGQSGFKALKAQDGRMHLLTWTMNAFKDREKEIFTLKSMEDYVARNAEKATMGEFDFWHVPYSDFGKITWQGIVGRFLVESGPFDDTLVGRQAEKFFLKYTKSHPVIAPEGWGASHKYYYKEADKQNGVYTWFDKRKTTVLPRSAAANIFNPELEVTIMDQKQKDALTEIWGADTAAQIIKLGESKTKELEQAGVATKENTESPDSGESQENKEGESQETKGAESTTTETKPATESEQEVKEIITEIAGELQLGALSDAFKTLGNAVGKLGENVQAINTRLDALEVTDEKKLAEKEQSLPRYSWFVASQAAETVLGENDALKSARPQVPTAISKLARTE